MSKIEEADPPLKYIPNATTITNTSLERFPNVKYFLETLTANTDIAAKHVGRSFQYNKDVEKNRSYSAHGLFIDLFIRKHLSNQYNIEMVDRRTQRILDNPDDYPISPNLREAIKKHYEIYKDPKIKAMDIVKSIKLVSLSHIIFFRRSIPKEEYSVNENNLLEIVRYLETLPYKSTDLNPSLDCDYFKADADLIFDNKAIYEIKTSKFKSLAFGEPEITLSKFYQPIIYGFGFYKKTGFKIKHYKIYNCLLGDEYSIVLDDIDFQLFEKVLKRDVTIFSRLHEILTDQMILDLSLFSENDGEIKDKE